jgi:hypothetical protein
VIWEQGVAAQETLLSLSVERNGVEQRRVMLGNRMGFCSLPSLGVIQYVVA